MKIAVVGYGYWGPNVVRSLCSLLDPTDVIVFDSREEQLARARSEHAQIGTAAAWRPLLDDGNVTALYLCTPASTHFDLASEALAAGKHVLIEKPFTTSSKEAIALFDEARRRGLALMAGHIFLYSPAARELKALIDADELGDIRYLYSRRTSLGPRAREDVSVVWDYFSHDAYLIPYLINCLPLDVSALGWAYLRPGIADVVFARMRFPGTVLASCQASWYDPLKVRNLCIVGSRRMAVYDDADPQTPLTLYERGYQPFDGLDSFGNCGLRRYDDGARPVAVDDEQPLVAQCRAFLEAVECGHTPFGEEASVKATIATLEAAERSLKDGGRCITIENLGLAA